MLFFGRNLLYSRRRFEPANNAAGRGEFKWRGKIFGSQVCSSGQPPGCSSNDHHNILESFFNFEFRAHSWRLLTTVLPSCQVLQKIDIYSWRSGKFQEISTDTNQEQCTVSDERWILSPRRVIRRRQTQRYLRRLVDSKFISGRKPPDAVRVRKRH